MTTHKIVRHAPHWYSAQGIGDYFWWDIFFEFGEWILCSMSGKTHGRFRSIDEALYFIGYVGD